MIFITTGSRSFQFNRLLEAVDNAIENGIITDEIFAQIGSSNYQIKNYKYKDFLNHDEFNEKLSKCDIVLTHGGTGVIVNSVKMGKRVVAIPRLSKYGEVIDDHQIQLVQAFSQMDMVTPCYECTSEMIAQAIDMAKKKKIKQYRSNTGAIIDSIDDFINRKKLKILIVSNMYPDEKHPSAGVFVKKFCDEVSKIGIEYDLGIMRCYNNKFEKILNYIKFYIGTFTKILCGKYDLIYIHYASNSSVPVLWASKLKKISIYTNVHGSDVVPENRMQEKFQKYTREILKKSEKVIVPSEYFKEYVGDKYQLDSSKIYIYPSSGIDRNLFRQLPSEVIDNKMDEYKLNKNLITFCYVGRISSNKGWDTYLKAIKILKDRMKKANFILVGSGIEKKQLEELCKKLNIEDMLIRFDLLPQDELVSIYNVSDVFIFPTRREGESLGLVAIEAMSCGTPVIASDFAAPKYYVQDEINGYKFDMNNHKKLADIMEKFILGDYSKNKLVSGCLETANMYDNKAIVGKLKEIFEVTNYK